MDANSGTTEGTLGMAAPSSDPAERTARRVPGSRVGEDPSSPAFVGLLTLALTVFEANRPPGRAACVEELAP